ncbi:hypothetical protein HMPREF1870_01131 [Bacteroidales bacterium KA00344]|nr:hypothetical protein HMPREF1870_01131 [Bacteroidales bacterium KA00344]
MVLKMMRTGIDDEFHRNKRMILTVIGTKICLIRLQSANKPYLCIWKLRKECNLLEMSVG